MQEYSRAQSDGEQATAGLGGRFTDWDQRSKLLILLSASTAASLLAQGDYENAKSSLKAAFTTSVFGSLFTMVYVDWVDLVLAVAAGQKRANARGLYLGLGYKVTGSS